MVNDWHEHAGDVVTDDVAEIDLDDSWTRPSRGRDTDTEDSEVDLSVDDDSLAGEEEGDESGDRQRRRRRRRRRRTGRREPDATEVAPRDDLADDDLSVDEPDEELVGEDDEAGEPEVARPPRSESRRRRDPRGPRRRSRRTDDERERPVAERSSRETDIPSRYDEEEIELADQVDDLDVDDLVDDLDDDFADEVGQDLGADDDRPKHTKIPTWDQAIGVLIDSNLASRTRSPQGNGRGRGRGRGPRRS